MFKTRVQSRVTVHTRFVSKAAFALMLATTMSACKATSNYFTSNNASVGAGDGGAVDSTAGLRVRYKPKSGVDGFVHKFGDTTAGCEIPLASVDTPTSIRCMLNMMEYDMWFYGFEYEISVPQNFCTYIKERPYSYFRAEAGYGPSTLAMQVTNGVITSCQIDGIAGTNTGTLCGNAEATFGVDGAVASCAYDYSKGDASSLGPNCCAGKVVGSVQTTTGGSTTVVAIDNDYGGKITNCIESPFEKVASWPTSSSTGRAINLVTALNGSSMLKSVKLPSPITELISRPLQHSAFLVAGFYGWDDYAADASTWYANAQIPRALVPVVDRGAAGTHAGTGATAFTVETTEGSINIQCLGPAGEKRHVIDVYANAWNTIEDYQAFKTNGVASAVDPNRTGVAGVDCAAVNGGSCNTIWGFDDMIKDTTSWGGSGNPAAWVFPEDFSIFTPNPY